MFSWSKLLLSVVLLARLIVNSNSRTGSWISQSDDSYSNSDSYWDYDSYYDYYSSSGSSSSYDRHRHHRYDSNDDEYEDYDSDSIYDDGSNSENNHDNYIDKSECINECTDGVEMPNFCKYVEYLWDDPSIPYEKRNNIGLAKYLTSKHVIKAASLINIGKIYKLAYNFHNNLPHFGTRSWFQSLRHSPGIGRGDRHVWYEYSPNEKQCGRGWAYLDQRVMASAIGNTGTQLDGLGHIFYINGDNGDSNNYLFHNGFKGSDIMTESGVKYIGIEQLPAFSTKAILLDVAGYINSDPLPQDFKINTDIVDATLNYQGLSRDDIEEGDVILFYTGWANAHYEPKENDDRDLYYSGSPGITLDTVINIFSPKGVLLLGADNTSVEYIGVDETLSAPVHLHWIICNGGFLYENLNLVEWVTDARKNDVPYVGAFYYSPAQIEGGVGGLGTPMVIV